MGLSIGLRHPWKNQKRCSLYFLHTLLDTSRSRRVSVHHLHKTQEKSWDQQTMLARLGNVYDIVLATIFLQNTWLYRLF
jgi:hypothetical protein